MERPLIQIIYDLWLVVLSLCLALGFGVMTVTFFKDRRIVRGTFTGLLMLLMAASPILYAADLAGFVELSDEDRREGE